MMHSPIQLLWAERTGWQYPTLLSLDFPDFPEGKYKKWYTDTIGSDKCKVQNLHREVVKCFGEFSDNLDDARKAMQSMEDTPEFSRAVTLWNLLSIIIQQHVKLFQGFIDWTEPLKIIDKENDRQLKKVQQDLHRKLQSPFRRALSCKYTFWVHRLIWHLTSVR